MDGLDPVNREGRRQKIVDRLLTLYLYNRVSEQSKMWGDVKLQKLVFLSEKKMLEEQKRGFHYRFFRWDHGPMSKSLYEDHDFLKSNDLVDSESLQVSDLGESILDDASELLDANEGVVQYIDSVTEEFGSESGSRLKSIVYDLEVSPLTSGNSIRVEDIPEGVDIYFAIPDRMAERTFSIDDEWMETLDILFTESSREGLDDAIRRAQNSESKSLTLENV